MEINNNNQVGNPIPASTASAIISPEVWAAMTPEQRSQYPAEIQQIMNQQMAIMTQQATAATAAGMPQVPPMSTPIPNLNPNQDVVIPPAPAAVNNDEGVKKLSLKEQKELLKNAELGTGCSRDWYEFYKVSFTNQHDISAILAGVAIGVLTVLIVQGVVYLIKKA